MYFGLCVPSRSYSPVMDVDPDGHEDVVSRYAGDQSAAQAQTEEDEDEMPRNPLNANLTFRNYVPKDKYLRKHHLRSAPPDLVATLEEQFQKELTKLDDEELYQEATKEANWDLKRELNDKMTVLDQATQVALSQLLRLKMSAK